MALEPLPTLLKQLQTRQGWQAQQQFQHLLRSWPEIVGVTVAQQTRPLGISPQGVLRVATSSSVWAQNLSFSRHHILSKLNQWLTPPLRDIHFSAGYWQEDASPLALQQYSPTVQLPPRPPAEEPQQKRDAHQAFQAWAKAVRLRAQSLPLCPHCGCPTPALELERWSVCSLCAVRALH